MVKIYAPASIGNVSVGFDVLGAAVTPLDGTLLGDCVSVEASDRFALHCRGRFVDSLPAAAQENIVYQCWQRFCEVTGRELAVEMVLEKNMPIGSGLGSSACSVVAALAALNRFAGDPLDAQRLLTLMGELEGRISGSVHYDNVAPCYLGGLQLMLEAQGIISQPVPCFDDWLWVMAYPGIKVSTAEARAILPPLTRRLRAPRPPFGGVHSCLPYPPAVAGRGADAGCDRRTLPLWPAAGLCRCPPGRR